MEMTRHQSDRKEAAISALIEDQRLATTPVRLLNFIGTFTANEMTTNVSRTKVDG
jgi:hypothetical protein